MEVVMVVDMDVATGDMVPHVEIKELPNATIPSLISSLVLHSVMARPEESEELAAMLEDTVVEREGLDISKIPKMKPVLPWRSQMTMLLLLWILAMMMMRLQPWKLLPIPQFLKREDSRYEIYQLPTS
jgi:hypothetical protein